MIQKGKKAAAAAVLISKVFAQLFQTSSFHLCKYNWLDGLLHFGLKTQTKKNIEWEREKSLADIDVICENMGFVHGLGIDFSAGACHF